MKTQDLIKELKSSKLVAECPCGEEFKLSDALIFDGTKPFPKEAIEAQQALIAGLKEMKEELKKKKKLTTEKAQITTKAVNVGKHLEKILPTVKDFKWALPDCRFLANPIDLIVFNGLEKDKVESINFIEVKTGKAKLNSHQKSVRDAIQDNKVSYKVLK